MPQLEYYTKEDQLYYRFNNTINGFTLPLTVKAGDLSGVLKPSAEWQHIKWGSTEKLRVSEDFYIKVKRNTDHSK